MSSTKSRLETRHLSYVFALACALFAAPLLAQGEAEVLRFEGGLWWNGEGFEPAVFHAVDGMLRSRWEGEAGDVVDLSGGYVVPPFADAHRHAFADGMDVDEQVAECLYHGIYYVKNPNNLAVLTDRSRVGGPASVDAVFSNGGLTSTGGHPAQIYAWLVDRDALPGVDDPEGQAYFAVDTRADLDARWPEIRAGRPDFLKVYLETSEEHERRRGDPEFFGRRGLDPNLLPAIVERAHADGLRVSAHVRTAEDVRHALAAGVDEINHLPLERIREADARRAAEAGTVIVTTTLSHRPTGDVEDVDAVHRHNLKLLRDAGARIAIGTDNNEVTAVDEVENLRRLGVFSDRELLVMWTETTPAAIFPDRPVGRLEDGREASFLVLGGDPLGDFERAKDIRLRVKQGQILHPPAPPAKRSGHGPAAHGG